MTFELPQLGYAYDALEPHIDKETMTIHHTKHHQAYTDKFNAALEGHDNLKQMSAEEIITKLNSVPEEVRSAVRNNGGGYLNHSFFWPLLKKDVEFKGEIADAITTKFGSFDKFKEEFTNAAATQFGSGWAWLVLSNGELEIMKTSNQDSPLTEGKTPLLCIDVWEHSYYIKYKNDRPAYIKAFWNVVNWDQVNEHFVKAKG
ncbi:MAG: superoxide dismutase [Candidatus Aenigmatarchaeota archaeon]|nr:superoxide dismutase [Nanoarchaeota archaeon]